MMIVLFFPIIIFSVLASILPNASATPVVGSSIGRVKAASGNLFPGVNLNDSMTLDFSSDPLVAVNTKTSTSRGLYKNLDGVFSLRVAGGAFTQVFDDRIPAKPVPGTSPFLDENRSVANGGNLLLVWHLRGDRLIISDSLDQILDVTRLSGAGGSIRNRDPSGETLSDLRFRVNRPSVGTQHSEPVATSTRHPAIMILIGSGFLVLFGLARRKLRKH